MYSIPSLLNLYKWISFRVLIPVIHLLIPFDKDIFESRDDAILLLIYGRLKFNLFVNPWINSMALNSSHPKDTDIFFSNRYLTAFPFVLLSGSRHAITTLFIEA